MAETQAINVADAATAISAMMAPEQGQAEVDEAQPAEVSDEDTEAAASEEDESGVEDAPDEETPEEQSGEEEEQEEQEQPQTFTVKVDGKEVTVTLDELQKGYSRTQDQEKAASRSHRRSLSSHPRYPSIASEPRCKRQTDRLRILCNQAGRCSSSLFGLQLGYTGAEGLQFSNDVGNKLGRAILHRLHNRLTICVNSVFGPDNRTGANFLGFVRDKTNTF